MVGPLNAAVTGDTEPPQVTSKTGSPARTEAALDECDLTVSGEKMVGTIDADNGTIEFVKTAPAKRPR